VRQESTTAGPHSLDGREPIPLPPKPAGREARVYNGWAALPGWAGANPLASKPRGVRQKSTTAGPHQGAAICNRRCFAAAIGKSPLLDLPLRLCQVGAIQVQFGDWDDSYVGEIFL
jgi:hypothetical protein